MPETRHALNTAFKGLRCLGFQDNEIRILQEHSLKDLKEEFNRLLDELNALNIEN